MKEFEGNTPLHELHEAYAKEKLEAVHEEIGWILFGDEEFGTQEKALDELRTWFIPPEYYDEEEIEEDDEEEVGDDGLTDTVRKKYEEFVEKITSELNKLHEATENNDFLTTSSVLDEILILLRGIPNQKNELVQGAAELAQGAQEAIAPVLRDIEKDKAFHKNQYELPLEE